MVKLHHLFDWCKRIGLLKSKVSRRKSSTNSNPFMVDLFRLPPTQSRAPMHSSAASVFRSSRDRDMDESRLPLTITG